MRTNTGLGNNVRLHVTLPPRDVRDGGMDCCQRYLDPILPCVCMCNSEHDLAISLFNSVVGETLVCTGTYYSHMLGYAMKQLSW
eukprot:1265006-Amphidinium_carterae.1